MTTDSGLSEAGGRAKAAHKLVLGCPVFTQDGEEIGKVKEVQGRYFRVDVPMHPDYWLSHDAIATATPEAITLFVDRDSLADAKSGSPDDTVSGSMTGTADVEAVDAGELPAPAGESLLAGEAQPGNWDRAWAVPVGAAWEQVVANYQVDWETLNAGQDSEWQQAEPAYRFGHEMAVDERYRGLTWEESEPDLRQIYGEWCRQQGYAQTAGWSQARVQAHDTWERMRGARDSGSW
jgi:hypothetical protein